MTWASIDPSNKAGIAYWDNDRLVNTTVLRRVGARGKYALGAFTHPTRFIAWRLALCQCSAAVCEEGFGRFATAVKSQAEIRGYIKCACDSIGYHDGRVIGLSVVNVNEWRRVIKEAFGVSWPATTERQKALSVQLVKRHHGVDVTDDEADAVLLGCAALRMGLVNGGVK